MDLGYELRFDDARIVGNRMDFSRFFFWGGGGKVFSFFLKVKSFFVNLLVFHSFFNMRIVDYCGMRKS